MSIVFAILIEIVTIICAFGVMFAGNMRTTGSTGDDGRSAIMVFIGGSVVAALVAASHWIGW